MSDKMLELFDKCMKHGITITIRPCLLDARIEIRGEYKHLACVQFVSIEEMRSCKIDIFEYAVDYVINKLLEKGGIEG